MRGRPIKRTLRGGNLQPLKIKTFYELGVRDSCLGVLAAVVVRRGQPPFCPENTPATSLAGPGCPPPHCVDGPYSVAALGRFVKAASPWGRPPEHRHRTACRGGTRTGPGGSHRRPAPIVRPT